MSEKKKIPEIRFKGFEWEWEEKRLGDIAEINPKSTLPDEFLYVDLESVLGTRLINSRVEYINTAPSRAQRLAKYGDVFYQTVRPYQKNNFLFDIVDSNFEFVFSTGYAQLRTTDLVNNNYIFQSIQREVFVNEVMLRCTGTSYPAINSTELSKIKVGIPKDLKESEKIGDVLRTIDNIINKIIEKIEKLQSYKQSMLQKMFPKEGEKVPEIRFEGFEGEWEEKLIKNIFKVTRGNVLSTKNISACKSNRCIYPVYSSQTQNNGLLGYYNEFLFENAITWTTDGANAGTVKFRKGKFYSTNVNGVLLSEEGYANYCISEILNREAYKHVSYVGNPKLMNNVMEKIKIKIPNSIDEQEKISEIIEKIDKKITLQQEKLDTYKNLKKTLLDKMFV